VRWLVLIGFARDEVPHRPPFIDNDPSERLIVVWEGVLEDEISSAGLHLGDRVREHLWWKVGVQAPRTRSSDRIERQS
jgi:hypothetical protein